MVDYIKKNISNLKPSATLAINEKIKQLLKDGKKVFNFGFGQSPFPIPEKIVSVLRDNAHKKDYLPMQGLPELREAISKYLLKRTGVDYKKENIIITPGSKEAMLLIHIAFNGEIIIPAPGWVSYEPQAEIGSNKVHWLETSRENNWFPTATELKKKIQGKNIRCLVQNNKDRYRRNIGICYLKKQDINSWLVKNGYAIAYRRYSKKYINDEQYAEDNKLGIWQGTFMKPEKWRRIMN